MLETIEKPFPKFDREAFEIGLKINPLRYPPLNKGRVLTHLNYNAKNLQEILSEGSIESLADYIDYTGFYGCEFTPEETEDGNFESRIVHICRHVKNIILSTESFDRSYRKQFLEIELIKLNDYAVNVQFKFKGIMSTGSKVSNSKLARDIEQEFFDMMKLYEKQDSNVIAIFGEAFNHVVMDKHNFALKLIQPF